jgi:hypothetical protein
MEALRIRIPQRYQAGIAKLIALPNDSINELLSALDEMPTTFNLERLKSHISARVSAISMSDLEGIVDALSSVCFLRFDTDLSLSDFTEQIVKAINASGNENLRISGSGSERFKENLSKLLSGKLLSIAARAKSIILEHDHVFGRARVITDIRPVFRENTEHSPIAAVVVHMLKLHYIQDQQHKDIFVALDTVDIEALIESLKQAQEKADALKSTLALAQIPYIDAE